MRPKCPPVAFFDKDGLQILSEHVHEKRWEDLAARYGVVLTKDMFDMPRWLRVPTSSGGLKTVMGYLRGSHEDIICQWILDNRPEPNAPPPPLSDMKRDLLELYQAYSGLLVPRREIPELIANLSARGFVVGTVTGCSADIANINAAVLAVSGRPEMDFRVTADETNRHKPNPAPYLLGIKKAQKHIAKEYGYHFSEEEIAARGIVFEDSRTGVLAALAVPDLRCIQYLLPGQKPYTPPSRDERSRLFHATRPSDLRRILGRVFGF